jgi:4-hydroxybenzoate polyprenyltransferase
VARRPQCDRSGQAPHRTTDAQGAGHRFTLHRLAPRAHALLRGVRVYQWAKNILVFVPLLTAHRIFAEGAARTSLLAFAAFSLAASSVYVANDLVDLDDDRRHPAKRSRALAAGDLGIAFAVALAPALLLGSTAIALLLSPMFERLLLIYVAASLLYSFWLKRVALVDVFLLAGLYTLRILAGAAAITVPVSHWLLAFSLFAFLSLALVKRFVEVENIAAREQIRVAGRGYLAKDGTLLAMLGTASGYLSVLVLALYITSRDVMALYSRPELLWFLVPLMLYGLSRVWFLAHRGKLQEDPLLFALHDPASYAMAAAIALVMFAAT